MDLRQQYRNMSLDILNATLERGKLSEEEAQICREVIAEKQNTPSPEQAANGNSTENPDYGASIAACKFISFIGWMIAWGSVLVAGYLFYQSKGMFRYGDGEAKMLLILGVLGTAGSVLIGGLLLVIAGQAGRAVMDNANYARQMLDRMK